MNTFQSQPWIESFSPREFEVLRLISNGLSNREIAEKLYLSIETIKWYNKQMFMKLGVNNRIQAINKASELNLLEADHTLTSQEKTSLPGNLPAQLTSYVGREKAIGEIKALLLEHRLVVLTGAGGSGKTRLALKVGEKLQTAYRDGIWLVELANISDTSLVLRTIAQVLNLTERADAALDEVLKRYLSRKHLLLLIDNLEHLLDCAPLIGELLAAAPQLSVLGTSRERLHIYGEQEYPVNPLNLPDLQSVSLPENLRNVESIALFIKRARAVQPTLSLDDEALQDLAQICVRLDGLPLAIELCAPMVKVFPPGVIVERIEEGLDVIPSGPRDLPARQQTLRGTIQWSYDLLEEHEKRLFVRMAVFNGGGTLRAVEAICGDGLSGNVGNILSALVNKNLVLARERQDGEIHFSMLETIHQYARDKLLASDEARGLAGRHAKYFIKVAKQGAIELRGPNQIIWTDRFITMHDNIRIALEWVFEMGETDAALWFISYLFEFWLRYADFEEARRWLERVIAVSDAQQFPELYTSALMKISWINWLQDRADEARTLAERALPLARSQSNKHNTVIALLNLGLILVLQNDDFDRGQTYIEEAKNICQEIHIEWELARSFMALAVAKSRQNEYIKARSLYSKAFHLYKKIGDINFQCVVNRLIGDLEVQQNNLTKGVEAYRESLMIARNVKNNLQIAYNIYALAGVEKVKGNYPRAIRLYLASKKILLDMGVLWIENDSKVDEALASARATLGEAEFQFAWEAGQHMTMEEAIGFALGDKSQLESIN
jgi:predicted ATPase/DNA-binding CsgD family transcriptional regulator